MGRFVETIRVSTAREILAWTETHPCIPEVEWPMDATQGTGDNDRFIVAVPVPARAGDEWATEIGGHPASLVAFFAAPDADVDRIRANVI